jgi:hypothetical protein
MREVFELLNHHNVNYAVLRNYNNLFEDNIYLEGHGDIDLICDNSSFLAQTIQANPQEFHLKKRIPDGTHYYLYIQDNYVSLDLRHVGDGYYCMKWEKDMLSRKVLYQEFYVLNDKDYFFSLIYHAILHKKVFSEDYRNRLTEMAKNMNIDCGSSSSSDFIRLLEKFMIENGYRYQYPKDKFVPFKTKNIQDKRLLNFNLNDYLNHKLFHYKVDTINILVKMKRLFYKNKLLSK